MFFKKIEPRFTTKGNSIAGNGNFNIFNLGDVVRVVADNYYKDCIGRVCVLIKRKLLVHFGGGESKLFDPEELSMYCSQSELNKKRIGLEKESLSLFQKN